LVVELNLLNRIFLFGNFQSFWLASAFGLASSWLRGFSSRLSLLGCFVVSFRRHRLSASPSCLWCPLEFLALDFSTYLFVPRPSSVHRSQGSKNNHLHLLVISVCFVVFSFPLSDFPSLFLLFVRLQGSVPRILIS